MSYYRKRKEALREEGKKHQAFISEENLAWWDVVAYTDHLYEQAKKYGLVKEFKREGII